MYIYDIINGRFVTNDNHNNNFVNNITFLYRSNNPPY